jgi:eukaryotic-like serine/threonine-protein kinase
MSDDSHAVDRFEPDESLESDHLLSRIIELDEALCVEPTTEISIDGTDDALSESTRDHLERVVECLRFIADVRREYHGTTVDHADADAPRKGVPGRGPKNNGESNAQLTIGSFEVVRELGRGGHGVVFLAEDPFLGRRVALKVPRPEFLFSREMGRRFIGEAQAAARLDHPNIVRVIDAGYDGPVCYIAQELCSGPSLAVWLRDRPHGIAPRLAASILSELADGLAHAHQRGILHRDLKPANVLLQPKHADAVEQASADRGIDSSCRADAPLADGSRFTPKLADFGICKAFDDDKDRTLTQTGTVLGTPAYLAPEQALGKVSEIGPPSDIYGLGAIMYEMLSGHPLIVGDSSVDVLRRIAYEDPPPLHESGVDVPPDLEAICLKCLEKERARRYATAGELADDLRRFLVGEPVRARRLNPAARLVRRIRRKQFSSRAVLVGALAVGLALTAIGGMYWRTRQQHTAAIAILEHKQREETAALQRGYADDLRRADFLVRRAMTLGGTPDSLAGQARAILARYIPPAGQPDLRGFEWHYLWKVLHPRSVVPTFPLLRTIRAHRREAYFVAFSPDVRRVATASADQTARVWDVESGQLCATLAGHTHDVNCVAFSPDGKVVATASEDGTVRLWDATNGGSREVLLKHTDEISGVAFNPVNGDLTAITNDGLLKVWSGPSRKEQATIDGHNGKRIEALAYSPNGSLLATVGGDSHLVLWDVKHSYAALSKYPVTQSQAIAFSHDGQILAASDLFIVGMLRVPSGEPMTGFGIRGKQIRSLQFTGDDSSLITGGDEFASNLVDLATGESWNPFSTSGTIWSVATSTDGRRVATTDAEGNLRIWDSSARNRFHRTDLDVRGGIEMRAAISPDGRNLAVAGARAFRPDCHEFGDLSVWDISSTEPRPIARLRQPDACKHIGGLAFAPEGAGVVYAASTDPGRWRLGLADVKSGKTRFAEVDTRSGPLESLSISRGSTIVTTDSPPNEPGGELQFRDSRTGKRVGRIAMLRKGKPIVALSPVEPILATDAANSDRRIELFQIPEGRKLATWTSFKEELWSLTFTRDGKFLIAFTRAARIHILDRRTGQTVRQISVLGFPIVEPYSLADSPNGRTLAVGTQNGVLLVDVETGTPMCLLSLPAPIRALTDLAFTPDGGTLITTAETQGGSSGVYLWECRPAIGRDSSGSQTESRKQPGDGDWLLRPRRQQ